MLHLITVGTVLWGLWNGMKINKLLWQWVEDYKFYRVIYWLDGQKHLVFIQEADIRGVDKTVPDAVAYWLRAELDCEPEEHVFR
jgi:hypothetical protein